MSASTTCLNPQATTRSEYVRGVLAALPMTLGLVPLALVLGAKAAQKGFSAAEVPIMTGLNFAGGSEFAAVQLWTSPPHILLIVAMTFLVNSRYLLTGATFVPYFRHLKKREVFLSLFCMCDESWALGLADAQRRASLGEEPSFFLPYYLGASSVIYASWVGCTALGGVLGPILGDVDGYGFDMAFPAVFLVILRGMWKDFSTARPWFVSLVVAALVHLFVPGAWYVPAGALAGIAAAFFRSRNL